MLNEQALTTRRAIFILLTVFQFVIPIAVTGLPKLTFSNDYRTYFDEDFPPLVAFEAMQDEFAPADNILIAVAPEDGDVFAPRTLAALEALTEKAWQTPHSIRVDSLTNYQHAFVEGDDIAVEALFEDSVGLSPEERAERREIALSEPILAGNLVAKDGGAAGINVTVFLPTERDFIQTGESVGYVRDLIEEARTEYPWLSFRLSGELPLNLSFAETSSVDTATLFPLMFVVMLVLLAIIFRNVTGVVATMGLTISAILTALGAIGWLGARLTPDGVSAAAMIMPIAVADCVHVVNTYLKRHGEGDGKARAIISSLTSNWKAVTLTTLTTGIGFLSLTFSDSPPIRMMGITVCIGVIAAGLLTFTLLPAALYLLPSPKKRREQGFGFFGPMVDFIAARPRSIIAVIGTATLGLGVLAVAGNEVDETIANYFAPSTTFRQHNDWIGENLTGTTRLEVVLRSGEAQGVSDPEYLAAVDAFADWARAQPEAVSVRAFSDIVKRLNKSMNGGDLEEYRIPQDSALVAQYVLLYELSLPLGLDLADQVTIDKSASRVFLALRKMSNREVIDFEERMQAWLSQNAPPEMQTALVGSAAMFSHQLDQNIQSVLGGLGVVLVAISAILILVLRSVRLGLISLVPNLAPILMAFGVWSLVQGEIGLAMSIVMGLTLGIVVDDTMHFMIKYNEARGRLGMDALNAIRYVFATVGVALVTTTAVLTVAFSLLAFSSFAPNANLGTMTAITFAFALIVDFVLLPAMLLVLDGDKGTAETGRQAEVPELKGEAELV